MKPASTKKIGKSGMKPASTTKIGKEKDWIKLSFDARELYLPVNCKTPVKYIWDYHRDKLIIGFDGNIQLQNGEKKLFLETFLNIIE